MLKYIFKIFATAQAVELSHLNDRVYSHAGLRSINRSAEQPVLSSDRKRAHAVLAPVVGKAATTILKICEQVVPAVEEIRYCF